jgi:hypothetical protein
MKRYLLFGGKFSFPAGGWNDLKGQFDTEEEASAASQDDRLEWWHIVDLEQGDAIEEGENG